MLAFYDEDHNLFNTNPLRTVHNGRPGGPDEKLVLIRNDDATNYYTDLSVSYESTLDDYGPLGSSGWSVKFLSGSRQPTEQEWDSVTAYQAISLPDIGNNTVADTVTYHPFWVRVYCPGNSSAQIRESQVIRVFYDERKVGS